MKNYLLLIFSFVSFVTLAYSGLFEYDLLGGTELNGAGCVCHTTERDTTVSVWIEGPDTLMAGQTGVYKMFLANGPAEAGGYNVAGRFGIMSLLDSFSVWDYRSPNELTQSFPLVFPTPQDTIYWEFAYTAPDSVVIDTLYSCGLSIVYDSVPDFHDRWNFGPKFPVTVIDNVVPVELISFAAKANNRDAVLNWSTSTETNNAGFEIERKQIFNSQNYPDNNWERINFVNGNGTSNELHNYSYVDDNLAPGKYLYRLKQIDFNGTSKYSHTIEVEIFSPNDFVLEQNYPNPFNPGTKISWQSPVDGYQKLKVYDVIGNEVATLVNEYRSAGNYDILFDASHLSSGIYFYELVVDKFSSVKKMILLR